MAEKPEAGDSEDEVEDVYEVERIIDMRTEEGEVLYRVRWKNYSSDDDTWEPEAHLEDCREVLLGYKRALAEAKVTKDQDAKKCMKLPMKSDVFDADSDSDSDIDKPTDLHVKKKKKKKPREEEEEEEAPPLKEKRKKKKDKRKEDFRPRPAPESDEEELSPPPTPGRGTKMSDSKKRFVDSDEEEEAPVPSKKHRKDKAKDGGKHGKKENGEEGKKKKKKKKDRRGDLESTEDEATAPLEEELSEGPSESQTDDTTTTEKSRADDKPKNKKSKSELKLQGIKDLLQDKKGKKLETSSPMLSASGLAKLKSLTSSKSQGRDEPTPTSDSSDTPAPAQVHKKAKGKSHEATPAPPKIPSSSSSSSSSSSGAGASTSKTVEESKVVVAGDKEPTASTNLFEKFLLNCEAKDRVPRKQMVHQPTPTENTKPPKLIGKIEKRTKPTKESPARKPEPDKSKHTDAFRPSQSPGAMETGDRAEAEEEPAQKSKFGGEDRREEAQRWERRTQEDDRRRRRREDSEPRLFIACDDNQDPLESADKSDKGQASLNLGMDLNLDWMTLEDFQKHLNGEDEILSAPHLSPSELRDAVKSGDYMSVKLALNSKEDYNLDQEAYTVEQKSLSGKEKSLNEEEDILNEEKKTLCDEEKRLSDEEKPLCAAGNPRSLGNLHRSLGNLHRKRNPHRERNSLCKDEIPLCEENHLHKEEKHSLHNKKKTSCVEDNTSWDVEKTLCDIKKGAEESSLSGDEINENSSGDEVERQRLDSNVPSGSDPLPSNAESSCEDEYEQYPPKTAQAKKTCRKIFAPRKGTRSSLRSSTKMTVSACSTIDDDDKGKLDKKYFCLYCNEPHHKIARHLERMHAEEAAVAHAISFPELSKIRSLLLDQLCNKGNDQHNLEILQCGDEVVTKKIPSYSGASVRDYLPCQHCVAFFNKIDLWKHESSCNARKGQDETRGGKRVRIQAASSQLVPLPVYSTGGCEEIIHNMNQDDISCHIKNDPLICKYGNALSAKHGHAKSQFTYIGSKMRELARFVLNVNEMDCDVQYLHEVCVPSKFKLAVHAARKMSGHDPASDRYKTPSLALKIGYSLKRATEIAFGESRMTEDREAEEQAKRFIELLENDWNNCFSGLSLSAVPQCDEVDVSSLTEDLIKLQKFLKVAEDTAKKELLENPTNTVWKKLNEILLAEIALFNRKRTGEVAKMLLETYTNRKKAPASADIFNNLSRLEQELGDDKLTRLEIEGKNGRKMPVLLTERMISSLEILIANRDKVGVSKDNPYVFARSLDAASYIRGFDCLRKCAHECDAKNPESLIHATVRKEVAIHCQILNLNESELDQVAKLLGHDTQVHKEYYRLSENAAHLAQISKLLLAMDQVPVVIPAPSEERVVSPTYGTYPAGTDTGRTYPTETCPTGSSYPTETYSAKSYTVEAQPSRSYHAGTYPEKSYPSGLQSAMSYSAGTDSARAYPTVTHPAGTYPAGSYVAGTYTAETHDARSYPASAYASGTNPVRSYAEGTYPAGTHFVGTQLARSYPAGTYPAQTLPAQTLPAHTVITPTLHAQTLPTQTLSVGTVPEGTGSVGKVKVGTVWKRRPWSDAAKAAVKRQLGHFFSLMEVPGKRDCEVCLHNEPAVQDRTWRDIKNYVHNTVKSIKRKKGLTRVDPTQQTKKGAAKKEKETEAKSAKERVGGTMTVSAQERLEAGPVAIPRKQKIWGDEAQAAVRRQLGDFTKLMKIPGKKECDACIAAEPVLQGRTWKDVKNYVHNTLMTMCRRHISGKQNMDSEKPIPVTQKPALQQSPVVHQKPGVLLGHPEDHPVYLSL
ncbi:M-phase phosphoprotein 8 isoform 2-T2 [Salvelinus alpinus]|uniref:M-phase phosphoprotein 8 isoform X2 n=1 Tax=Salvelinus alpinus TaxID=8036 RepID=UPI0039FBAABE